MQPYLTSHPLDTLLTDDTFFLPSTRTQAFQGSACHWQSLPCRTVPMPQLRTWCCCLGSLTGAPAKPGTCHVPEGRGNPIQQLSVSFLIIELSSCLHSQGTIYVLKPIKRPQCPGLQNSTIFSHLYLFWTFWALKLQTHTQLCRILV